MMPTSVDVRCVECGDTHYGPWGLWRDDRGARMMCELCLAAHHIVATVCACNCEMTLEEFIELVSEQWDRAKEPPRRIFTTPEYPHAVEFLELLKRLKQRN